MTDSTSHSKFTGKHMAAVLVIGFGIVVAVNFFMASLATGGFHGVVVENSYVASQKFNGWLDEAEKSRALGWEVEAVRDESGFVVVEAANLPGEARVEADLRRPIGTREYASLSFAPFRDGHYRSTEPVTPGRWIVRLRIEAGGDIWTGESELR